MSGSWLVSWHPSPVGLPMLLCLPQAGSGCGQFRQWQKLLGPGVSVVGVQLPGRESRWSEPLPSTVDVAVAEIVDELAGPLSSGAPYTVFGHSLGGLLGYEIVRRVPRPPTALVVAASRPPHLCGSAAGSLGEDRGEESLQRMLDARGFGADDLDEDSRELMLELLRQDAKFSSTYEDPNWATVDCPVEAWGGALDETVTAEHLEGWRAYASGPFRRREFPGGHDFWADRPDLMAPALLDLIARPLKEVP